MPRTAGRGCWKASSHDEKVLGSGPSAAMVEDLEVESTEDMERRAVRSSFPTSRLRLWVRVYNPYYII